jgi:DHA1 family tetracycline resistance protein-like MFS transporter
MGNKRLLALFLVVFIGLLGFSIILPLLPYIAQTYGADPFTVGVLVASYAAAQLIGAPILGRLSDRFGRRPILFISVLGTLISLIMIALSHSLWFLFASRMLDGLTGGNISVAQAYITDVTDVKNRARGLGLIGAAFGLGFIFGPVSGGLLSQWGYALPAFVAAALTLVSLVMIAVWLPESLPLEKRVVKQKIMPPLNFKSMTNALRRPKIGPLLQIRFLFAMAFSTFQTIFSLYALKRFNLTAQDTGYVLTYVGLLSVFVQGFMIGKLSARFSEESLILVSTALMTVGCLGWALAPSVPILLVAMLPIAMAGGTLNTVINSALTHAAPQVEAGGLLGLSTSLESLTRVISPSLGGLLMQKISPAAPGFFTALIMALVTYYVWKSFKPKVNPPGGRLFEPLSTQAEPVEAPVEV